MGLRDDAEEGERIGQPPSPPEDPIGDAIRELVELNDINDHISMREILGRLVTANPGDWVADALSHEMIKTADLSRRIGYALGMARQIAGFMRDHAEDVKPDRRLSISAIKDMQRGAGETVLRDVERLIKMLETGRLPG